jgi:hypothetical protein
MAGPPLNGTYKSTDLGGLMLPGRYSEWWSGGIGPRTINNTVNDQSWDGATLGTQWWWYCPWQILAPQILVDTVVGGTGQKIWRLTYTGPGICWLNGTGEPWDGGDASYTAFVDLWIVILTETYLGGNIVGSIRTTSAQATFQGFNNECMSLTVQNQVWLGDTNGGPKPADYPMFLDWAVCSPPGLQAGEWGTISQITYSILGCEVVGTEETTWGAVKTRYRE